MPTLSKLSILVRTIKNGVGWRYNNKSQGKRAYDELLHKIQPNIKTLWVMRKTRLGKMFKPHDVILASVQFTDTDEVKVRPAVVLFD